MGQAQVVRFTTELESTDCCNCGVTFAFPADLMRMAREKGPNKTFYCPNGHPQHFTTSEVDRLKKQLERKEAELAEAHREAEYQRTLKDIADRATAAQRGVNTKLRKRISAGVCPCCHRTFKQLAAHMKTKHPDFKAEDPQATEQG
jgi:hypothetical protein